MNAKSDTASNKAVSGSRTTLKALQKREEKKPQPVYLLMSKTRPKKATKAKQGIGCDDLGLCQSRNPRCRDCINKE